MSNKANSSFIFYLVDKYAIFTKSGESNQFSDEGLQQFSEEYKAYSKVRDEALTQYLLNTPNLFRVHLPYSKWTMAVASNIVWYYDEIIITDPILDLLKSPIGNLEHQKYRLQDGLKFLLQFKESILGGYVLFGGENILPHKTGKFDSVSDSLLNNDELLAAFEMYTRMLKKPSPINDDPKDNLTQLMVEYFGMWGENKSMSMYIPPHVFNSEKLGNGVTFDFMTPFSFTRRSELIAMGKQDMLATMRNEYAKDVSIVLESITNAQRFQMPVLFYRDVDSAVARNYSNVNSTSNFQFANTTVYDFSAPYLTDIPPERLFETRTQIPQAFNDFRFFLFDLVSKTMRITVDPHEIRYRIDQEITSMLNKLQKEIKIAERKWKVHGIAAPVLAAVGSLGFVSSGLDFSKVAAFLLGSSGGIKGITTWFDVAADKEKAALNPVYFLWKAQANKN